MTNAGRPVLPARLLPRAAVPGADYRGGRGGSKASLTGTYNVIQDFPNVVIDYNDGYAYIAAMKLTENRTLVTGITSVTLDERRSACVSL
jgi:hypothetical protein